MTDRELKKISRIQLLEMLLAQSRELEQLRGELERAQAELNNRRIILQESGSLAEAALKLNGVFEAAQAAAEQYVQNAAELSRATAERCSKLEAETQAKCQRMLQEAEAETARLWEELHEKLQEPPQDEESWYKSLYSLNDESQAGSKVEL